ncbi:hypothetical protein KAI04_02870 [Candidatus Pacearchaeota archaeon]|nr:hypothetical protein [Candidatus Pacearchaeota archaeon]
MKKKRKKKLKINLTKKIKKKIYVLILIIGILLIIGSAYFLFIEGLIASEELTDRQVKKELEKILEINQNLDYESINLSEPWISFGIYQGRELVRGYSCSDICPENGGYKLIYKDIGSEELCNEIGGKTLYDYSWGKQFNGCEPIVD